MIVPQQVQRAVHGQKCNFFLQAMPAFQSLTGRRFNRNADFSQHMGCFPEHGREIELGSIWMLVIERERDDIRGSVFPAEMSVDGVHFAVADEGDVHQGFGSGNE